MVVKNIAGNLEAGEEDVNFDNIEPPPREQPTLVPGVTQRIELTFADTRPLPRLAVPKSKNSDSKYDYSAASEQPFTFGEDSKQEGK